MRQLRVFMLGLLCATGVPAVALGHDGDASALPEDASLEAPADAAKTEGVDVADKTPDGAADEAADEADDEAADEPPLLELGGRIHAAWEYERFDEPPTDDTDQSTNTFLVRRARLRLVARPLDWLRGEIDVDVAEVLDLGTSIVRDAYLEVSPLRQLEIRIGQFKKPFSRLELRSPARMRVIDRGLGNDLLIEDLGYGDRDIGLSVSGRLVKSLRLDYELGVYNGNGPNLDDVNGPKDVAGRLQVQPTTWLSLGGNASVKVFDPDDGSNQPDTGWAAGGDARLRGFGLRLHLEALVAADHQAYRENPNDPEFTSPLVVNALALLSQRHDFDVDWGFALEPIFKVEFLDPDTDVVDDELLLFTPGINSYFGEMLRVMAQAAFRSASRNSPGEYASGKTVTVMAALDF